LEDARSTKDINKDAMDKIYSTVDKNAKSGSP